MKADRMSQPAIYHHPLSMHALMARLALAEKGVAWESRTVDIGPAHENYAPWFARLNPEMTVPVLVHDDQVVCGAVAIGLHVDAHFDGPAITPVDEAGVAVMHAWCDARVDYSQRELAMGLAKNPRSLLARYDCARRVRRLQTLRQAHPELASAYAAKLADIAAWQEHCAQSKQVEADLRRLEHVLQGLNGHLAGRLFIAGDRWSIADAVWTAILANMRVIGLGEMISPLRLPTLAQYQQRMAARPSFAAAGAGLALPWRQAVTSYAAAIAALLGFDGPPKAAPTDH